MVAGRETTPGDAKATERLLAYWSTGEGGTAKIRWHDPGAYDRCVIELGRYVNPHVAHGLCNHLAKRATGMTPGADTYRLSHGGKIRGKVVGPG